MMSKKLTLSTAVFFLLIGAGFNSYAGESSFPASACVKWSSSYPEPLLSYSRIFNPSSTAWLRVDCPVVKTDFDGVFHDAGIEDSWIRVIDQHFTSNVSCQLVSYAHNLDGSMSYWSTGNKYSSGTDSKPQQLNTDALNGENSASHLYFSCQIPPTYSGVKSGLTTYNVDQ